MIGSCRLDLATTGINKLDSTPASPKVTRMVVLNVNDEKIGDFGIFNVTYVIFGCCERVTFLLRRHGWYVAMILDLCYRICVHVANVFFHC